MINKILLEESLSNALPLPNLDTKLFAMVNNDAWLGNSELQGGDLEKTSKVLLGVLDLCSTAGDTATPEITNFKHVVQQIKTNNEYIVKITSDGLAKEKEIAQYITEIEQHHKFPCMIKISDNEYHLCTKYDQEDAHIVIRKINKSALEQVAKPKLTLGKSRASRIRRGLISSDDDDTTAPPPPPPVTTYEKVAKLFSEIQSRIVELPAELAAEITSGNRVTLDDIKAHADQQRLEEIHKLASQFQAEIQKLKPDESFFIPGGFFQHAMLYEFKLDKDGELSILTYNTGSGLEHHESNLEFEHGIFKKKYVPISAYKLPFAKTDSEDFTVYLQKLLIPQIASYWHTISTRSEFLDTIKPWDAEDLYKRILPLIAHLDGKLVDPHEVYPQVKFITGQRSGKCSEAVFHPLLRKMLHDNETAYQRFMVAYRKIVIEKFVMDSVAANTVNSPMENRQIRHAIANLMAKIYKHKDKFSDEETRAMMGWVNKIEQQINIAPIYPSAQHDVLPNLALQITDSEISTEQIAAMQQQLNSIGDFVTIEQASGINFPDDPEIKTTPEHITPQISSISGLLSLIKVDSKTDSQDINIEQVLLSMPLANLTGTAAEIEELITAYSEYLKKSFTDGGDRSRLDRLSPQQVAALGSILVIISKFDAEDLNPRIQELLTLTEGTTLFPNNKYNPYLASGNYQCDQRLIELSQFFANPPLAKKKPANNIEEVYAALITDHEKSILLTCYHHAANKDLMLKYAFTYGGVRGDPTPHLSDTNKCLLVLCNIHRLTEPEQIAALKNSALIKNFDMLARIENSMHALYSIFTRGDISEKTSHDTAKVRVSISYDEKNFQKPYTFSLCTPMYASKFYLSDQIKNSQSKVNLENVTNFIRHDFNKKRSETHAPVTNSWFKESDPFLSSAIQEATTKEKVTTEELLFKQFCHARSAATCQLSAVIDFFQANANLISNPDWQNIFYLNVFQPNILKNTIERTPEIQHTIDIFLNNIAISNTWDKQLNSTACFAIKMQIKINLYLAETKNTKALENLRLLDKKIVELINTTKNPTIQRELHQYSTYLLDGLLKFDPQQELQQARINRYVKTKLLGTKLTSTHANTNPADFIAQENVNLTMKKYLLADLDAVKTTILQTLRDLKLLAESQKIDKASFIYPDVFIATADEVIKVNLETGQILKKSGEFLSLPADLLQNQQFVKLLADSVSMGTHHIDAKSNAAVFMVKDPNSNSTFTIQKTTAGYIFQRSFVLPEQKSSNYQLVDFAAIKHLTKFLPKTLLDDNHRFWISISEPKQLIIENRHTGNLVCHIGDQISILDQPLGKYTLLTQAEMLAPQYRVLMEILNNFEATEFIQIQKLASPTLGIPNSVPYVIKLARYNLELHVTNLDPLTILSMNEPKGELVLSRGFKHGVGIKNALFIKKANDEIVGLLPRQYFISEQIEPKAEGKFEYTPLCLDTKAQHQQMILDEAKLALPIPRYIGQSKMLTFKVDRFGNFIAENASDALYLAYSQLVNFDPQAAMETLRNCELRGGLKGTQQELEHLMLFFYGLPAAQDKEENITSKTINNPEFIAVKTYALYLYANFKHKQQQIELEPPDTEDDKCFSVDTQAFQKSLTDVIDKYLLTYVLNKNNIPANFRLTAKEESDCLLVSSGDTMLDLEYRKLKLVGIKKTKHVDPAALSLEETALLQSKALTVETKYQTHSTVNMAKCIRSLPSERHRTSQEIAHKKDAEHIGKILLGHIYDKKGYIEKSKYRELWDITKNKSALENLKLGLSEQDFFKNFMTYYTLATNNKENHTIERSMLLQFLEKKMDIIGSDNIVFGAELFIALYGALQGQVEFNFDKISTYMEEIHNTDRYSKTLLGYKFDWDKFYRDFITMPKSSNILCHVPTIKATTVVESKMFSELLQQQQSALGKVAEHYVSTPMNLTQSSDQILANHGLSDLKTIVNVNSYSDLTKKHLLEQQQQKKQAYAKLQTNSTFIASAQQELVIEHELGKLQNQHIAVEADQAAAIFNSKEIRAQLQTKVSAQVAQTTSKLAELEQALLNMVILAPSENRSVLDNKLGVAGRILPAIDIKTLINAYLQGDEESFINITGLTKAEVYKLYQHIAEYLVIATHNQQLIKIKEQLAGLATVDQPDQFDLKELMESIIANNEVDLRNDPPALTVFQYFTKTLLRKEQIDYLREQLKQNDAGAFNNSISQLIMGFGKTFLLPILAKAKAKGNNLSVIEVPESLFANNVANFNKTSLEYLNQKTNAFCFNRRTDCSSKNLKTMYEWLTSIKHARDYVVTTGESVASINLRYFEILHLIAQKLMHGTKENELHELKEQAHWLKKLIKTFKFEADVIVDEVHAGLDVKKQLIYSIGTADIDSQEVNFAIDLYKFLLPLKVNIGTDPDVIVTIEDIMRNPGIVPTNNNEVIWEQIISEIANKLTTTSNSPITNITKIIEPELLRNYLLNKLAADKGQEQALFAKLNQHEKDMLALYKAELTHLLPETLGKQNKKHYGLLSENQQTASAQLCAVPFISSDTPNILSKKGDIVKTTDFANPDETINYTTQAYLLQGLPPTLVMQILTKLKDIAELELKRDGNTCYAETLTGKLFAELIPALDGNITLDNFEVPENLARLVASLPNYRPFVFYTLQHHILPTIKVEHATLEHDSNKRAHLYHSIQGISGTIDNYRSISRMTFDKTKYIGTNGITIDHVVNKTASIHTITSPDITNLVEQLLGEQTSNQSLTHAIIDAGGIFTGVTNLKVAQEIAKHLTDKREYVLFLNTNNELSAIHVKHPEDIILIGASDKKSIKAKLNNCQEENWFTYYDQSHTVGMDIPQTATATAAITFAYDTKLTQFLQAAMRMRKLPQGQKLNIFMEQSLSTACFKDKSPIKVEQIIDFLANNEMEYLSEAHLRYILQEMENVLYQELLHKLLATDNDDDTNILAAINKCSSLFIKNKAISLFARYGQSENAEADLHNVLQQKKTELVSLRQLLAADISIGLDDKTFHSEMDKLITVAKEICKPKILFKERSDQGREVEAETETQTDIRTELELHVDLDRETTTMTGSHTQSNYDNWLRDGINTILQSPQLAFSDFITGNKLMTLAAMSANSDASLPMVQLNPNIFITNNHAKIYAEQYNYFDAYKMPFQNVLIILQPDNTLQAVLITPNEAEDLIKQDACKSKQNGSRVWIESVTGTIVAGNKPDAGFETHTNYFQLKEQIKFFNGDLKALYAQDLYYWLPKQLEHKRKILSRQILPNRPDQLEYANPLLMRAKELNTKYEQVVVDYLQARLTSTMIDDVSQWERAIKSNFPTADFKRIHTIVADIFIPEELLATAGEQFTAASKLIARLSYMPLSTTALQQIYPELALKSCQHLLALYTLKQILPVIASGQNIDKSLMLQQQAQALAALNGIDKSMLQQLLILAVKEKDTYLIEACFKVHSDLLYGIKLLDTESHPVFCALENNDYVNLAILLHGHALEEPVLEQAFVAAIAHKDFTAIKVLLESCDNIKLDKKTIENLTVILTQAAADDLLKMLPSKLTTSQDGFIVTLQEKYAALAAHLHSLLPPDAQIYKDPMEPNMPVKTAPVYTLDYPNFTLTKFNDQHGITQLMLACSRGDSDAAAQLLAHGASFTREITKTSYTALTFAMLSKDAKTIAALLGAKADNIPAIFNNLKLNNLKTILKQLTENFSAPPKNAELLEQSRLVLTNLIIECLSAPNNLATETKYQLSILFAKLVENQQFDLANELIKLGESKQLDIMEQCSWLLLKCVHDNNIAGAKYLAEYRPELILAESSYTLKVAKPRDRYVNRIEYEDKTITGIPLLLCIAPSFARICDKETVPQRYEILVDLLGILKSKGIKPDTNNFYQGNYDLKAASYKGCSQCILDSLSVTNSSPEELRTKIIETEVQLIHFLDNHKLRHELLTSLSGNLDRYNLCTHLPLLDICLNQQPTPLYGMTEYEKNTPLAFKLLRSVCDSRYSSSSSLLSFLTQDENKALASNIHDILMRLLPLSNPTELEKIINYSADVYHDDKHKKHTLFFMAQLALNLSNHRQGILTTISPYITNIPVNDKNNLLLWSIENNFAEIMHILLAKGSKLSDAIGLDILLQDRDLIQRLFADKPEQLFELLQRETDISWLKILETTVANKNSVLTAAVIKIINKSSPPPSTETITTIKELAVRTMDELIAELELVKEIDSQTYEGRGEISKKQLTIIANIELTQAFLTMPNQDIYTKDQIHKLFFILLNNISDISSKPITTQVLAQLAPTVINASNSAQVIEILLGSENFITQCNACLPALTPILTAEDLNKLATKALSLNIEWPSAEKSQQYYRLLDNFQLTERSDIDRILVEAINNNNQELLKYFFEPDLKISERNITDEVLLALVTKKNSYLLDQLLTKESYSHRILPLIASKIKATEYTAKDLIDIYNKVSHTCGELLLSTLLDDRAIDPVALNNAYIERINVSTLQVSKLVEMVNKNLSSLQIYQKTLNTHVDGLIKILSSATLGKNIGSTDVVYQALTHLTETRLKSHSEERPLLSKVQAEKVAEVMQNIATITQDSGSTHRTTLNKPRT